MLELSAKADFLLNRSLEILFHRCRLSFHSPSANIELFQSERVCFRCFARATMKNKASSTAHTVRSAVKDGRISKSIITVIANNNHTENHISMHGRYTHGILNQELSTQPAQHLILFCDMPESWSECGTGDSGICALLCKYSPSIATIYC